MLFENKCKSVIAGSVVERIAIQAGNSASPVNGADWASIGNEWSDVSPQKFLVASITKPLVAMAVLKLAAEGHLSLSERVGRFLPSFAKGAYRRITVRHLLIHSSGLPDMLPNNAELRASHASLGDFLHEAASIVLEFPTASDCRYSSVGYMLLAAIIERSSTVACATFLDEQFFTPLHMTNTWLGIPQSQKAELLPKVESCQLPIWQQDAPTWDWNSDYWRCLGAPWGGLVSTADDLGRYARMMLSGGVSGTGQQILPASVVATAGQNQLASIAAEPTYTGSLRSWGFGWRRQWPAHHASFGDFVSAETYGHWGATGTLMWIDPVAGRYAVILTTTPYEQSQPYIQRISNVIATALG